MLVDTLIKNGYVIDPGSGQEGEADVAIKNGRIVKIPSGEDIDANTVINAKGKYVSPGWIDYHSHTMPIGNMLAPISPTLAEIPNGVTATVDQGTAGVSNYQIYLGVMKFSILKFKANLNFADIGMSGVGTIDGIYPTQIYDYESWDGKIDLWKNAFDRHPNELLGMKFLFMNKVLFNGGVHRGIETLKKAVEVCNKLDKKLTCHVAQCPTPMEEVTNLLRKGDVLTHCFAGDYGHTILDEKGNVKEEIWEARKRGVVMDTAEDIGNGCIPVDKAAIEQGFYPDCISTDLTQYTIYKTNRVLIGHAMAKYYDFGMPLNEVIRAVTETPAKVMEMYGEIGTLAPGSFGDVTIFEKRDQDVEYTDKFGNRAQGKTLFAPLCTVVNGSIAWRSIDFLVEE